ncbi:MAG TPA: hypothetical protein VMF62_10465 [Acetobacteraceae bacterium]|jgi:hypothetical protein|nr:hypothetical protein [Acetobacteraceae bacterium]
MSLPGEAFLAVWNDVPPDLEDEFNVWYMREHMPERVGVPGFLGGRRYIAWERSFHRYFALYPTRTLAVLNGPDYLARLNAPSPWTQKMFPKLLNYIRGACRIVASRSEGVGGFIATIRLSLSEPERGLEKQASTAAAAEIHGLDGVMGVHIGVVDPEVTGVQSMERQLRAGEGSFDAVVLIETTSRHGAEEAMPTIEETLTALPNMAPNRTSGIYGLAHLFEPRGV